MSKIVLEPASDGKWIVVGKEYEIPSGSLEEVLLGIRAFWSDGVGFGHLGLSQNEATHAELAKMAEKMGYRLVKRQDD